MDRKRIKLVLLLVLLCACISACSKNEPAIVNPNVEMTSEPTSSPIPNHNDSLTNKVSLLTIFGEDIMTNVTNGNLQGTDIAIGLTYKELVDQLGEPTVIDFWNGGAFAGFELFSVFIDKYEQAEGAAVPILDDEGKVYIMMFPCEDASTLTVSNVIDVLGQPISSGPEVDYDEAVEGMFSHNFISLDDQGNEYELVITSEGEQVDSRVASITLSLPKNQWVS